MKEKFLKQAGREYSPNQRLAALAVMFPIFVILIPLAIYYFGRLINRWLGWPLIQLGVGSYIIGGLLILAGFGLGIWSIYVLFTLGRGTPAPVMATQKLIVKLPYTFCRNPMALGTIVAYLGVALAFRSWGAVTVVALPAVVLLLYIRFIEEREMALRFGAEYEDYRRRTPFIVPRLF